MSKGKPPLFSVLPDPQHGRFIGIAGPFFNYISGKVEIFGHFKLKATALGFIVGHIRGLRSDHKLYSFRYTIKSDRSSIRTEHSTSMCLGNGCLYHTTSTRTWGWYSCLLVKPAIIPSFFQVV